MSIKTGLKWTEIAFELESAKEFPISPTQHHDQPQSSQKRLPRRDMEAATSVDADAALRRVPARSKQTSDGK